MAPRQTDTASDEIKQLRAQVEDLTAQLNTAEMRLREMGIADSITGLYSYRYFLGRVTEEVVRADRFNLEVSCILIGIDSPSFEGLLEVSRMLKESCRTYDIPARWSQNELITLLPATDLDGAQNFAERFRLAVQAVFADHASLSGLTVSLGVAAYPSAGLEEAQALLECANGALHAAQQAGGNRTMVKD